MLDALLAYITNYLYGMRSVTYIDIDFRSGIVVALVCVGLIYEKVISTVLLRNSQLYVRRVSYQNISVCVMDAGFDLWFAYTQFFFRFMTSWPL